MCRKVLITLGILSLLCTTRAKADDGYAYCPQREAYVYLYDSAAGFQVLAQVKCGAKLAVLDARNKDRVRVRTADGIEGYVLRESITLNPPPGSRPTPPSPKPQPPQPQPQPQAQPPAPPQPPSPPKVESQPQPQSQPERRPQPQPQVEPEPQPEPQIQSQPPSEVHAEAKSKPERKPQRKHEARQQPAAPTFRPFSTVGYVPRMDFFGGYSFLNAGTSGLTARQNLNGFEGAVAVHANKWLAGEIDLSSYYKTIKILNVGTFAFRDYAGMAGPRVNISKLFLHVLAGIDHLSGSTNFYAAGTSAKSNVLAGAGGGGVQWNVSRHVALRVSGDYVLSRFGGLNQNNIRAAVGLVIGAGSVRRE